MQLMICRRKLLEIYTGYAGRTQLRRRQVQIQRKKNLKIVSYSSVFSFLSFSLSHSSAYERRGRAKLWSNDEGDEQDAEFILALISCFTHSLSSSLSLFSLLSFYLYSSPLFSLQALIGVLVIGVGLGLVMIVCSSSHKSYSLLSYPQFLL